MEITILGSGTSMGVPVVGCDCAVCHSTDPRNHRTRPSVLVEMDGFRILIDTSIDFRQQALREGIGDLDAVLLTHHHVDHLLGMDDLRSINIFRQKVIPVYASAQTLEHVRRIFSYAFQTNLPSDVPKIRLIEIDENSFKIHGHSITPIPLWHGNLKVFGYRIGDFAYCTDVSQIPPESFPLLKNLQVLVLDGLRFRPHPTHFTIPQAIEMAQKIRARITYLTHLTHEVDHATVEPQLPEGVRLAFDGLKIHLPV